MDNEKQAPADHADPITAPAEDGLDPTRNASQTAEQRIQFGENVRPARPKPTGDDDGLVFAPAPMRSRRHSVASIPQVLSAKDKLRLKKEEEAAKKHVNIDEHLLTHEEVAERYKTKINLNKPADSPGLTAQQAEEALLQHGPNILV
jgi:sodium/potassium-transporting ATPase subunit alpha